MKRLVISVVFYMVCATSHATTPFSPRVFASDGWIHVVGFAWPDQNGKVLIVRTRDTTSFFSLEELGMEPGVLECVSTAGHQWYQQSIGYVILLPDRDKDSLSRRRVLYLRDKEGRETALDLSSGELMDFSTISDKKTISQIKLSSGELIDLPTMSDRYVITKRSISEAASLLRSNNAQDREAGAMHLGQLLARDYLQELKGLLNDDAYASQKSGDETKRIYFVREAAQKAIDLISGQNTANQSVHSIADSVGSE